MNPSKNTNHPFRKVKKTDTKNPNTPVDPFDLFTGGKTAELAIFYNTAADTVENYIKSLSQQPVDKPLKNADELDDKVLSYLKQYLWKGNYENKNTSGQPITSDEKDIVRQLLKKLDGMRNFHSHIWHDNAVLQFTTALKNFIEERHDYAVLELEKDPINKSKLYNEAYAEFKLFKTHHGKYIITQDGRTFLLSLFLNKGNMAALLQQRMGSKRNDMPEYQFKHKVYTFYCHREGSSWNNTGLDNEVLDKEEVEKQERILKGRQAYKIINYLNDKPAYLNDADSLPLYYKDSNDHTVKVIGMPSLKEYIKANSLLQKIRISPTVVQAFPEADTEDERIINERTKAIEEKKREGKGYIKWTENEQHEFEISFNTLRHIVSDILLSREFEKNYVENDVLKLKTVSAEDHFYGVLKDAIASREYIYTTLKEQSAQKAINAEEFKIKKLFNSIYINYSENTDSIDNVFYTIDQLRHLPILATPKVEELLINWHYSFTNKKENEINKRLKLLNYIRPANMSFDKTPYKNKEGLISIPVNKEPEPLVFHLSYYYKEQEQKRREEDNFLEWGMRYLMDFNLIPDCYLEVEKYVFDKKFTDTISEYKLKPEIQYVKQLPENYRLRIRDGHLNIALKNITQEAATPDFYKLRIGEKAMKYLMYAVFDTLKSADKTVNDFLITMAKDFATCLEPGTQKQFALLESFAIPEFLHKAGALPANKINTATPVRLELQKVLQKKTEWLTRQLTNMNHYNRNQKNEAILKTYTFFDFSNVEHKKFLRKNEYQQMSICHYMLNQNPDKVPGLINNTFKLKNRLPKEVYDFIKQAAVDENVQSRLDNLFINVVNNRLQFFMGMYDLVKDENMPVKLVKQQLTFLNLTLSDANLNDEKRNSRQFSRKESLLFIPFNIHPALVLKYFYPDDFAAKKFDGNTAHNKGDKKYINLFAGIRKNLIFSKILVRGFYDITLFERQYNISAALLTTEEAKQLLQKQLQKLIGQIIDTHTKDVLLSRIAQQYLQVYDEVMAEQFSQLRSKGNINVARLFSNEVAVKLLKVNFKIKDYKEDEIKAMPASIHISMRLHNADDYFFRMKKDKLYHLALHYQNFRQEELDFYKDEPEHIEKIQAWPNGSQQNPIPLGHLLQEYKNIGNMAKRLMEYILRYEKTTIEKHLQQMEIQHPTQSKNNCMIISSPEPNYMDFATVHSLDINTNAEIKTTISRLRNSCLHNHIPLTGSYSKQAQPSTVLAVALSITKRLAPDREKYKVYEQETKTEAGNV
jgi:hypothetical protein